MLALCSLFSWCVQELWLGTPQTFNHLANSVDAWDSAAKVLKALKVMWWRVQEEQQCKILGKSMGLKTWCEHEVFCIHGQGLDTECLHRKGRKVKAAEEDYSKLPGQSHLTWWFPQDRSFQRAWVLDVKRALNPSWTSPVSHDCTNGHTAVWDKCVGHSDILDDSEFST